MPIAIVSSLSNSGVHCWWSGSVDFHTPPPAPPANTVPSGATAMPVMRPVLNPEPEPEFDQYGDRYRRSSGK